MTLLASSVDWTNVLIALIAGVPSIIAAIGVLFVNRRIATPSGTSLGRQVESSHHVALANNQRLVSISDKLKAPVRALGAEEEAKVPKLTGNGSPTPGTEH